MLQVSMGVFRVVSSYPLIGYNMRL